MTVETWTQADLERLIGQEESSNLEFKRVAALDNTDGKKSELVKDVVALANAAGGTIVYGIVEGDGGVAAALDVGTKTDPLWIEQVLDSNIEPRIAGVIVARIALETGGHAIAIEVPQATSLAPHQSTREHRYYRRYGRKVLAMLDHEVRDLMRRGQVPHLHVMMFLTHLDGDRFRISVALGNKSPAPAEYGIVKVGVDLRLKPPAALDGFEAISGSMSANGKEGPIWIYVRNFIPPDHLPIFKEQNWAWMNFDVTIEPNSQYPIFYSVACPGFSEAWGGLITRAQDPVAEAAWTTEML